MTGGGIDLFRERLEERVAAAGLTLDAAAAECMERYYRVLTRWNASINLTSLELDPPTAAALDRLFVEPLLAAEFVPRTPLVWLDLGSGGGSPAIPLKVVRPAASLTMVDSVAKKGVFLREACRTAGLSDVVVKTARIEDLPGLLAGVRADLLTVRAVRMDSKVMKTANHLLKQGGWLLHFGADVDTLPAGFYPLARRELTAPGDSLMVFERQ